MQPDQSQPTTPNDSPVQPQVIQPQVLPAAPTPAAPVTLTPAASASPVPTPSAAPVAQSMPASSLLQDRVTIQPPVPQASMPPVTTPPSTLPVGHDEAIPSETLADAANQSAKKNFHGVSFMTAGAVGALSIFVIVAGFLITKRVQQSRVAATVEKQKKIEKQLANAKPLKATPVAATPAPATQPATSTAGAAAAKKTTAAAAKVAAPNQTVLESKCFKITVPLPNDIQGDQNDCSAGGGFTSANSYFDVTPITQSFVTMQQAVVFAKAVYKLSVISERQVTIGGQEGYEILYNFTQDEGGTIPVAKILISAKGKNYTNGIDEKITGFEVNMAADTAANKAAVATLESTWVWK